MISRKIKILVQESHSCTILVDGCSINIKYYKNNINFRSIEDIQRLFQNIDEVFAGTKSFGDVCKLIYGKNLLAILDAAYTEKIIGLFEKKYEETIGKSYVSFEDFFNRFFSFPYTRKYSNFQFVAYLKESTSEIASKINIRDRYLSITHNDEFEVKYISTVGNVASFFINGRSFEICLRGRPHLRDCNVVLDTIGVLQAALDGKNRTGVMSVIEQIGNIATLRIMQICYPQLAIDYFISAAEDKIKRRQCIYPNLLLKEYFNSAPYRDEARIFYFIILQELEKRVPEWKKMLIDKNKQEIFSQKRMWTIFYNSDSGTLHWRVLTFIGEETLQNEFRVFLREISMLGSMEPDTHAIISRFSDIVVCIDALYNALDVYLESIHALTKVNVQLLISYLFQSTDYECATIHRVISSLRIFYNYTTGIENDSPISAFHGIYLPRVLPNPTNPISKEGKEAIFQGFCKLPRVVQIGIKIACCTGIRSGSFAELMTHSLIHQGEQFYLRVFLKKTYKYRIKNGLPTYIDYSIPKEFGEEIEQFISDTQDLRDRLEKPYLLIYQPNYRRRETSLPPMVLSGQSLADDMTKILDAAQIYTDDGIPERTSLRNFRAEMGRLLFANGKSAQEVSEYLGNSPMVAQTHYDNYLPIDDAQMYDKLWQETIEKGITAHTKQKLPPQTVMYGTCNSQKECPGKDCRKCPSLIKCKEGDCTN